MGFTCLRRRLGRRFHTDSNGRSDKPRTLPKVLVGGALASYSWYLWSNYKEVRGREETGQMSAGRV